jgi:hypothetical protein
MGQRGNHKGKSQLFHLWVCQSGFFVCVVGGEMLNSGLWACKAGTLLTSAPPPFGNEIIALLIFFFFFWWYWGFGLRTLCLPGRHSTTWATPSAQENVMYLKITTVEWTGFQPQKSLYCPALLEALPGGPSHWHLPQPWVRGLLTHSTIVHVVLFPLFSAPPF